ncbi:sulfite reductase hemo protein, partial [Aureobasidium melanogenum]
MPETLLGIRSDDQGRTETIAPGQEDHLPALCAKVHARVTAFLAAQASTDRLRGVQEQTRLSLKVLDEALERYSLAELSLSYNGGKDCLVLLILYLAALHAHSVKTSTPLPDRLDSVYIVSPHPFPEVEDFVQLSIDTYRLNLARYAKSMRQAFEDYLHDNSHVKAIFVGTRRTDPHGATLKYFDPTDRGWPAFMRIHPVIDWHYAEVWTFIRHLNIPYCSLYDKGYTSLGGTTDTHPNPVLKAKNENDSYRPAYELVQDEEERTLVEFVIQVIIAAMASILTAGEAVARIAYLASDVVVSVQPSLASDSEFSNFFTTYQQNKASGLVSTSPEIIPVKHNADPLLSAFQPLRSGKLVSVTTSSSILVRSVPHLYKLAQYPVVLHVALQPAGYPDYSDITSIRQSGFTFLQSESLQEAQDLAVTAHALAIKSGKGVIHFFDSANLANDNPINQEDRELVRKILKAEQYTAASSTESGLYADDGKVATRTIAGAATGVNGSATPERTGASVDKPASAPISDRESSSGSSSDDRNGSSDSASVVSSNATSVESVSSRPVTSEDIDVFTTQIWSELFESTGRRYKAFEYSGPEDTESAVFLFGSDTALFAQEVDKATSSDEFYGAGIITARLYRPWLGAKLLQTLPKSLKKIAVLEQIRRKTTRWGPLLLDLLVSIKSAGNAGPLVVGHQLGYIEPSTIRQALKGIFQNLSSPSPIQNLEIGNHEGPKNAEQQFELEQPKVENAYMKILDQLFGNRLHVANRLGADDAGVSNEISATPEYGFGSLVARSEHRERFISEVQTAAKSGDFATDAPKQQLSQWLLEAQQASKANTLAPEVISSLNSDKSALATELLSNQGLFFKESQWLIGSDAWAYDLGNSGVHHVLASDKNVNMLIIDSQPYSERAAADASRRKKDIGLYAMNFGNAYVASVAVYSSYTQVLQSMLEAEQFNGPSVVVAYLPYSKETDSPLSVLQETKKAVDIGYWPLYRWNPRAEENGEENFQLDSERIRQELKEFLKRDNYLTQLMKRNPQFSANLSQSYGSEVRQIQKRKAKDAYSSLLEGLQGAPLTILFASDNGNSENLAKRLGNRGKARGLKTMVMAMDDYPLEDLSTEENVVMISSVAGQGEFPQNGRNFWEGVKNSTDLDLASVNFSVFGLGDSHYWPRKEDKIYYNKPAKDLYARVLTLGGKSLVDCGLGDDQDPDGYQTAYNEWEP